MPLSFYSPALDLMVAIVRSYEIDPVPLLQDLAIDPRKIADINARFRLSQVLGMFQRMEEIIPESSFGLKATEYWHPSHMGPLGYAWMTSDNLRAAFNRLQRFSKIVSEGVMLTLVEDNDSIALEFHFLTDTALTSRSDVAMAMLLAMVRCTGGPKLHPVSVAFSHPPPKDAAPYYTRFQCPLEFSASSTFFQLSKDEADKPRSSSHAQLSLLHDQLMREYLGNLDKDNIVERVKAAIVSELPSGHISDAVIARELFMTERTLQRRLQREGTTFKRLLTEIRQELAEQYMQDSRLTLQEISFLLGFAELSSFSRAFKRWKGMSPKYFRSSAMN
ncbi:AraC family transcriptional regulator [Thiolapillus sp.]